MTGLHGHGRFSAKAHASIVTTANSTRDTDGELSIPSSEVLRGYSLAGAASRPINCKLGKLVDSAM